MHLPVGPLRRPHRGHRHRYRGRWATFEHHATRAAHRRLTREDARPLQAFVLELGRMLSLAGTAVSETQERLTTIAVAYGVSDARIVVLPTALMISFGRSGRATLDAIPELAGTLRLDQISALCLSRHGRTDHIAARAS